MARRISLSTLCVLAAACALEAQSPPPTSPIPSGNRTIESNQNHVYAALHEVIVTTADGIEHVIHFAKDLVVHGGSGKGEDALKGLGAGQTVVVHYAHAGNQDTAKEIDVVGGDRGLKTAEGTLVRVNRSRQQIVIRFADGRTETWQLTKQAASDAGLDLDTAPPDNTHVIIYYEDAGGQKVAHYFKKVS